MPETQLLRRGVVGVARLGVGRATPRHQGTIDRHQGRRQLQQRRGCGNRARRRHRPGLTLPLCQVLGAIGHHPNIREIGAHRLKPRRLPALALHESDGGIRQQARQGQPGESPAAAQIDQRRRRLKLREPGTHHAVDQVAIHRVGDLVNRREVLPFEAHAIQHGHHPRRIIRCHRGTASLRRRHQAVRRTHRFT